MQQNNVNIQSGFSLIEVLIVIVLIIIVTVFALASFDRSKMQLQRQNVARELKVYFDRARFDAVKRRAEGTSRSVVSIENNQSFSVTTDLNQDGQLNPATEKRTLSFAGSSAGGFVGIGSYPVSIYFDRHGHAVDVNNNLINPTFTICNENCTNSQGGISSNSTNSTLVRVSSTGTVIVSPGGSAASSPSNPTGLTTVSEDANINPLVRVPAGN
ncbi:MAG: prepilin-type N-terminal cleavage/methylation domain-containing protein [Acidobacteriota bacterium]|nr:prepilin-type N-terminal cleavage/methylation domain-containing protein [Acidobacteriota bacterium]